MTRNSALKTSSKVSIGLAIFLVIMAVLVNTTALGESQWLSVLFGVSALNFTLRATIPLILGALCGILCERTGIINIGIEGMMLGGAFAAFGGQGGHQQLAVDGQPGHGRRWGHDDLAVCLACCMPLFPFAIAWTRSSPAR